MREKAQNSLQKLKEMQPRSKYVTISNDITADWHKCPVDLGKVNRIAIMEWARKKCIGQYSRDWDCYFFENQKDAFAFQLKWGKSA